MEALVAMEVEEVDMVQVEVEAQAWEDLLIIGKMISNPRSMFWRKEKLMWALLPRMAKIMPRWMSRRSQMTN